MNRPTFRLGGVLLVTVLLFSANPLFAEEVPTEGLRAEMEKRWPDAISFYEAYLENHPSRGDLWLRLVDIFSVLKQPEKVMETLRSAIDNGVTDNPEIYYRLSQGYGALKDPDKALEAINKAVDLKPDSIPYHRARAQIATWAGEYVLAAESYQIVVEANPDDDDMRLSASRIQSWGGKLDNSAENLEVYLEKHPKNLTALLDYSRVQSWRGSYVSALETLEKYLEDGGDPEEYQRAKARYLARADRPTKSLEIVDPMIARDSRDYDALYTQVLALKQARRFETSVQSLGIISDIKPGAKDTKDLNRFVKTALRPSVTLDTRFSSDSDTIDIFGLSLSGMNPINNEKYFRAGVDLEWISAESSSGLNAVTGEENIQKTGGWVGLEGRIDKNLWALGHIGYESSDVDSGAFLYKAGLAYRPRDTLRLSFLSGHGLHAVSPKAVSLDVERTANTVRAIWNPKIEYIIDTQLGYDFFSDDNQSWNFSLAPRKAVIRGEWFNLDIGASGRWMGFKDTISNGYYNPNFYQQYLAVFMAFIKFSDDDGLSLVVAPGAQKDDTFTDFQFSGNFSFELTIGLYRDWMMKVRGSLIESNGVLNRPYNQQAIGLSITRRF